MLELLIFTILTIIYFISKYYIKDSSTMRIATGLYFFIILGSQFYFNMSMVSNICGGSNMGYAVLVTIIPWIVIFGGMYVLLIMFPGWKRPFSNTFGYLVTRLAGINQVLYQLLKSPVSGDNQLKKTLHNIYTNPSLFINEINPSNFTNFVKDSAFMFVPNASKLPAMKEFYNMIRMKEFVSEFIWYLLTGMLVTTVSYNTVANSMCTQSVSEMKKRHNEYERNVVMESAKEKQAPPEKVYYVHD